MIRFLSIKDLAVIDYVELELDSGLTILTGETGAGKSILVGALGLLRGARGSSSLVRSGAKRAIVEASAEDADGTEHVLRREVTTAGRSRAFVDERLVSTATLRTVGASLLDLHGQHDHQALLDAGSHIALLDQFAGLTALRARVETAFGVWRAAQTNLERARFQLAGRAERKEMVAFQLREISEVDPVNDEDTSLAAERQILANADRIHRLAAASYAELYEGDDAVLDTLDRIWKQVEELAELDPSLVIHLKGRDTIVSQLQELAYALRTHVSGVEASPERLQTVEDRVATIDRLKRRYGPALTDVLRTRDRLQNESVQLESDIDADACETAVTRTVTAYDEIARDLSDHRRRHAMVLATRLEQSLAELAMERTRFQVTVAPPNGDPVRTAQGIDEVEFYFSANPGEDLQPLARIASGGELSRVMLALRTVTSSDAPGRTLVFDEVDAGIGGEAAVRVGAKLRQLAEQYQVLCVTHLPQIAACGTSHHRVKKLVKDGRTLMTIERLDEEARAAEIARMMTGRRVSGKVLESARELLTEAGAIKQPADRAARSNRRSPDLE